MMRTTLAILAGILVMWLTIFALQFIGHAAFPPPRGLDPQRQADLAQIIATAPFGSLAILVLSWVMGAFNGGFIAASLSRDHKRGAALVIGLLVMAAVCGMIFLVPQHPLWVSALGLLLPVPAALQAAGSAARQGKTRGNGLTPPR